MITGIPASTAARMWGLSAFGEESVTMSPSGFSATARSISLASSAGSKVLFVVDRYEQSTSYSLQAASKPFRITAANGPALDALFTYTMRTGAAPAEPRAAGDVPRRPPAPAAPAAASAPTARRSSRAFIVAILETTPEGARRSGASSSPAAIICASDVRATAADRAIRDARGVEEGVRVGLNGRMLAASLLLAAIVAAAFAVLVLAIGSLRGASREAQRGDRVAAAANDLERLAIDLETGERGFVVTGRQSFLRPWEEARRQIPAKERTLRALVRDPARRERVLELERAIDRYLRTWSVPTVTLARADLAAAVGEIATGVGKAQMDLIRALFADFLRDNSRLSASRRDRAASAGDRAVLLGVVGLAGSTALILAFGGYFARAVVAPVRRLARAAGRLGAGDLSTRVSEAGAAEIG